MQLSALMAATHAELLRVIVAADAEADWSGDGCGDVTGWLDGHCGLTRVHAREWIEVAEALESFPRVCAAFAEGRLSWDQIVPACRIAAAGGDDADIAARAVGLSARQLQVLARRARPAPDP